MANFKLVISRKDGRSFRTEIKSPQADRFLSMKIGDKLPGEILGAGGYEFEITGGSDSSGFPIRKGVGGTKRIRLLLASPPGFRPKAKGDRERKTVRGEVISDEIVQINMKVVKEGGTKLEDLFGKEEKPVEA